jgi:hypothetical protein
MPQTVQNGPIRSRHSALNGRNNLGIRADQHTSSTTFDLPDDALPAYLRPQAQQPVERPRAYAVPPREDPLRRYGHS